MHTLSDVHTASLCRYVKFDTFHPAVEKGLPVTRVISRVVLQQLLAQAAMKMGGRDLIYNGAHVVGYEHKVSEPFFNECCCQPLQLSAGSPSGLCSCQ